MSQTVTPAAQIIISVIPIVGIVMGAVVVFFYLLWHHKQIMKQLETGVYRRPSFSVPMFCILAGALLTGVGIVLSLLFLCVDGWSYPLLGGLIPLSLGISLLFVYSKLNRAGRHDSSTD